MTASRVQDLVACQTAASAGEGDDVVPDERSRSRKYRPEEFELRLSNQRNKRREGTCGYSRCLCIEADLKAELLGGTGERRSQG